MHHVHRCGAGHCAGARAGLADAVALIGSGVDATIVCGGSAGLNDLIVRPEIKFACGMISPPFNFKLRAQGLHGLGGQCELLGPYQATGAYLMHTWAWTHADPMCRDLRACARGQRRAMVPTWKPGMIALLGANFKPVNRSAGLPVDLERKP